MKLNTYTKGIILIVMGLVIYILGLPAVFSFFIICVGIFLIAFEYITHKYPPIPKPVTIPPKPENFSPVSVSSRVPFNKFCPKCGTENTSFNKFCGNCGADLALYQTPSREKIHSSNPNWVIIAIGIILITGIYLIPIIPVRTILGSSFVTLSQSMNICNNILASCGGTPVQVFFYMFWGLGIILILSGLAARH